MMNQRSLFIFLVLFISWSTRVKTEELPIGQTINLNKGNLKTILLGKQGGMYLFKSKEGNEELETAFSQLAMQNVDHKDVFIVVDPNDGASGKRFTKLRKIEDIALPAIHIIFKENGEKRVYVLDKETYSMNLEGISLFYDDWKNKRLDMAVRSELPPTEQNSPVYKLVGSTFKKIAIRSGKDVFVKFYTPWCGHCKKLAPIYEELAKEVAHNKNLIIAEFNMDANELEPQEGLSVKGFPTLFFFKGNDKRMCEKFVKYQGPRTKEDITQFIKANAFYEFTEPKADL